MDSLAQAARNLFGIQLESDQLDALTRFEHELLEWNQVFNLTSIRDAESIRVKHFLDSFSCTLAWTAQPPQHLLDLGTGAGFPGIPLKILYPHMRLTLVDSIAKKLKFCEHVVNLLGLANVDIVHSRAEDLGHSADYRERADWAVARAVAPLNELTEYLLPLVKVGGHALAQRGASAQAEVESARPAINLLGGRLDRLIPVTLPGLDEDRFLVIVEKVAPTPKDYPREPGMAKKHPLSTKSAD